MTAKKGSASQAKNEKGTAPQSNRTVKEATPPPSDGILNRVIANMTEDALSLKEQSELIEKAKSYKREIQDRLRDSRRDLVTLVKYASPDQLKRLKELHIDVEELGQSLNKVAELAFDILQKTAKGEMSNGDLYEAYVATFKNPEDAFSYTEFNIKCRSLFNSQRLIRIEVEGKKSRDYIVRINGFTPKK